MFKEEFKLERVSFDGFWKSPIQAFLIAIKIGWTANLVVIFAVDFCESDKFPAFSRYLRWVRVYNKAAGAYKTMIIITTSRHYFLVEDREEKNLL
uniref:Uncharacterized protein n=1 Tax=Romanomermis culicivorax TaxID=13658 RepID=A0A915I4H1_ROMCU